MLKRTGFKQKPRKPLHRGTSQLKKTPLRKVGRVGKANLEANKRLKDVLQGIVTCEMKLEGCMGGFTLQNAHRHKRAWYKGEVELLSDYKQVVKACTICHELTEYNRELNREVFNKLRGTV